MIIGKYPKSLYEAMALHVLLERMGYSKIKEVYFALAGNDVGVLLKADGKEAYLRIGSAELPPEVMKKKWREFVKEWNTGGSMTHEDKNKLYESSVVFNKKEIFAITLLGAGLWRIPPEPPRIKPN